MELWPYGALFPSRKMTMRMVRWLCSSYEQLSITDFSICTVSTFENAQVCTQMYLNIFHFSLKG